MEKIHYSKIIDKHGEYASWAIWAPIGEKPTSNIGDLSVFDLNKNSKLLEMVNPNIIMVGLNYSRETLGSRLSNFHDSRTIGKDYKLRHTFSGTEYEGAYMTDVFKNFVEVSSSNVIKHLKDNQNFELENIELFKQEINDLGCKNPLLIAFGNDTYKILNKYFGNKYKIKKVPHYSDYRIYSNPEKYKEKVLEILKNIN
jgi:hypothetical protein